MTTDTAEEVEGAVAELRAAHLPQVRGTLEQVAADLHARPEIRFEERFAAQRLSDELEAAGFAVERGTAGLETAFVGRWSTSGADDSTPTIAVFCEFDALEGMGHGCGHNLIAACGLGAGLLLKRVLTEHADPGRKAGGAGTTEARVVVIGSPGEEGAAGKVPMIEAGVLDGVDLAVMVHPAGGDAVGGTSLSRVALDVDFRGRASHAAGAPERGINALDASTLSLTAIGLLRQQLPDDVRVHAIVTDGGQAPNIIPEHTALRCFVRAADNAVLLDDVVPRVRRCFEGAAHATGCEVEIAQNTPPYLSLVSNPTLTELARRAFLATGRALAGGDAGSGSTDMGNVSQVVPAIHPMICLVEGVSPHTREFAAAAGEAETAAPVIADGAVILAAVALTVFRHPALAARAREEFSAR
ncbi:amidohydrolase [Brevibacterium salitolerans]|uniref:Peptidase M20 domain-containing protein 2 n=1 Tax=Brevibacterium salitolerans TaxID=1403566 RepID=A0ABP5IFW1_9MICO